MDFLKNLLLFWALFICWVVALNYAGLVEVNFTWPNEAWVETWANGLPVEPLAGDQIELANGTRITLCEGTMHPVIDPITKESRCVSSDNLKTECIWPDGEAYENNKIIKFYKAAEKIKANTSPTCKVIDKICVNGNFAPLDTLNKNDKQDYAFLECEIIDRTDTSLQTCRDENGTEYPAWSTRIRFLQSEVASDLECRFAQQYCNADGTWVWKFPTHTMKQCNFKWSVSSEFIKANPDSVFDANNKINPVVVGAVSIDTSKAGCVLPWGEKMLHGEQKVSFKDKVVAFDEECISRTHTCIDGKLDFPESYPFPSCTILKPRSCTIEETKVTVLHDSVKLFYNKWSIVWWKHICEEQIRRCNDWTLDGNDEFKYTSCKTTTTASSTVSGPYKCPNPYVGEYTSLDHGRAGVGYFKNVVGSTESCEGVVNGKTNKVSVNCAYGSIQPIGNGVKIYRTCVKGAPKSCKTPWGAIVANGASVTAFQNSSVGFGAQCQSETRVCNDGVLWGSFLFGSCSEGKPYDCTSPWGTIVVHGQSIQAYQTDSVPFGWNCVPQTRTCNNGTLAWSYAFKTCTQLIARDCYFEGRTVKHGTVITKHTAVSASSQGNDLEGESGNQCRWYSATCNDGTMQGNLLAHPEATLNGKCTL